MRPETQQLCRVLKDGFGILMEEAAHVAVPPGEQPFQEADVTTLGYDKQCNMGRLLGSLQGKGLGSGWRGGQEPRPLLRAQAFHLHLMAHCSQGLTPPDSGCSPWTGEKGSSAALRQSTGIWMASTLVLGLAAR